MDFQEKHKLKERIIRLKLEHHDLDMAISRLADDPASDELQLTRLKKRKLQLKDAISRLESMLIPDLDA
ncbi:MAG TPA: YdcH family protein [Gammaproteobacteria bacterium]|nr:YdcH family protein [Gammaproteobacteria bacterium]